jgi:hypothetical protein
MANRRAIVAGPQSYQEIGSAGIAADYLSVGATGIVGTAGSMAIYGDETGSGTDKTLVIGEQGNTDTGNVVHFFGSATGPGLLDGVVKIHGNLEVEGTENVLGDATFEANATFEGNTTFGDNSADTVTFVAGIASDIQFDAIGGGGGNRTIDIEASTAAGTSLVLGSGAAGGAGPSNGGDISLVPAAGIGGGYYGEVLIGNPSRVDPNDGKSGPAMLLNTGNPNQAGFRWNSTDTKLQYRVDNTTTWVDLVGGGGTLPPSTDQYSLLQGTGSGTWSETFTLILPDTLTAAGRGVTVQNQTTANIAGDALSVSAADGNGTGIGGDLNLDAGAASGATASGGSVRITGGTPGASGACGHVYIKAGENIGGTGARGNIYLDSGVTDGPGVIYFGTQGSSGETVQFGASGGNTVSIDFTANGLSKIISDVEFDNLANREIRMESGFGKGNSLTLLGMDSANDDGGALYATAGAAGGAGAGGSLYLTAGANNLGTGNGGNVEIVGGYAGTNTGGNVLIDAGQGIGTDGATFIGTQRGEIVFGLGGTTTSALYANSTTPGVRAGLRYHETTGDWEIRADNTNPYDWSALLYSGGPGSVPDGTTTHEILQWNQLTTQWTVQKDLTLAGDGDRTVGVQTNTAAGDGWDLSVAAGDSASAGGGGDLNLTAGDHAGANQVGGDVNITAGVGDDTGLAACGGNVLITGGAATTDGYGGGVLITGGAAGGGDGPRSGGPVILEAGASADSGYQVVFLQGGSLTLGSIGIGVNGTDGVYGLTHETDTIGIGGDYTTGTMIGIDSPARQMELGADAADVILITAALSLAATTRVMTDVVFDDAAPRSIYMETSLTGAGQDLTIRSGTGLAGANDGGDMFAIGGAGGAGALNINGGGGGDSWTYAGQGGAIGTGTSVAGVGGDSYLRGGTGGTGAAGVAAGAGGDTYVRGGPAGADATGLGAAGGRVYIQGADASGTGANNGGLVAIEAGDSTSLGSPGGVLLSPGWNSTASTGGSVIVGSATLEDYSYLLFYTDGSTTTQALGPGFRYVETNDWMEVYNPTSAAWERIASGSGGLVPDGTIENEILQWDNTGGQWLAQTDLTMPSNGGNATITQEATDTPTDRLVIEGHASVTGTVDAGPLWVYGGSTTGTGDGGGIQIRGGSAGAVGGVGGDVTINGGFGGDGSPATVWIGDNGGPTILGDTGATDVAFYANSDTALDRAGVRYNDTTDRWQIHYDNGGVTWLDISTGPSVPTGTATGQVMEWDNAGTQWTASDDIELPEGQAGTRTVSLQTHTAAGAAEDMIVSGGANTNIGAGTSGGDLTVKGGDSTADAGGALILTGGIGGTAIGDVVFGDGVNVSDIDFEGTAGNRIKSDVRFRDSGAGGTYAIIIDTPGAGSVGMSMNIAAAQGGSTATGGFNGGGMSLRGGLGGSSLGTGNGGDAGNLVIGGDSGGAAGPAGVAGDGSDVSISGGNAGAAGATGGAGGAISAVCGASTGNIAGPALTLTGGASVGTAIAGAVNIDGGANTGTANGASVNITGGDSTAATGGDVVLQGGSGGVQDGDIFIGNSQTANVTVGGANGMAMDVSAAIPVLGFNGTATINLPGGAATNNFRIQGTAVSDNVTAPNLDTLTAGPASDASALHTHTGLGALNPTSGEAITQYRVIAMGYDGANAPRAYHCDITSTPGAGTDGPLPIGFSAEGVAITTAFDVLQGGEITIPAAGWDANPAVTDVGKQVYAYGSAGQVSLTPPASGSGDWRTKVGILMSVVAATSGTIAIAIGDSVLMA